MRGGKKTTRHCTVIPPFFMNSWSPQLFNSSLIQSIKHFFPLFPSPQSSSVFFSLFSLSLKPRIKKHPSTPKQKKIKEQIVLLETDGRTNFPRDKLQEKKLNLNKTKEKFSQKTLQTKGTKIFKTLDDKFLKSVNASK